MAKRAAPRIPVSWGELLDKITILEIKSVRMTDDTALTNVRKELSQLRKIADPVLADHGEVTLLFAQLRAINETLWDIEDRIRDKEAAGEFDRDFVELARAVYKKNDQRGAKKKEIDRRLVSGLTEEKRYTSY